MRKAERLRQLEMQVLRMEMHLELMATALGNLIDSETDKLNNQASTLEAGKWYQKPSKDY
jgi:hypothetical protein